MQQIPWQKIKGLEREIRDLKNMGKKKYPKKKSKDPLYGILKGIKFSEKEIDEAQIKIFDFKDIK